ncbi:DUF6318 family protein [uncultured Cellulomonas sp.]|uniref:DUF6318 family protein n=1 Tax=uncultured Cellulomonas sp. TaxID=189682 RepID=UPI002601B854|nr:DUF6318 family protein [uncultured Cellulomonas sp.]
MLLRRGITLTATLAVLLAAGCTSQDPEPEPPPVAQSPTPTVEPPEPTPTVAPVVAPPPPPELERTDEVGAAAAAEYFLELYGYVMQTGDVAAWDALSWESCGFCSRTSGIATEIADANENFEGANITVTDTFVHPYDDLVGGYPVDVDFSQDEGTRRDASGDLIEASQADSGTIGVDVIHSDGGWKVVAVTAQDR